MNAEAVLYDNDGNEVGRVALEPGWDRALESQWACPVELDPESDLPPLPEYDGGGEMRTFGPEDRP